MIRRARATIVTIWGCAVLIVAVLGTVAVLHRQAERAAAVQAASAALEIYLQNAVASFNRYLINVDLVLAAQSAALDRATAPDGTVDALSLRGRWREIVEQHLLIRDLILVDPQGSILAAAMEATPRLGLSLPRGAIDDVLSGPFATLWVSPPAPSEATGEHSLWLARPMSGDWRRRVLLAEVPLPALTGLFSLGASQAEWGVTIERDDGILLASVPARDAMLGGRLPRPISSTADGRAIESRARIGDEPSIVAARTTLYPRVLVTAGVPVATIHAHVDREHAGDTPIAFAAALVVLGLAALLHWHLRGERMARAQVEQARERLAASHADLVRHIRAREEADAERARTRDLVTRLLAHTQEGYWHIDVGGCTVDVNPAMCDLLGRPRDEIIGRSIFDFVDDANAAVFRRQMALRREGKTGSYEISLRRPDGALVACINSATPIFDEHGQRVGSIGLWTDVNAIKLAQRALADTKATLDRALGAMDEGFIVVDAQDRVVIWNRRYLEIFPLLRDVLHEMTPISELWAAAARHMLPRGTDAERDAWIAERSSHIGSGRSFETVLPDGRIIEIVEHRTPDGGFVAIYRDVTAARAAERELAAAKATLEQALDAMSDGFVVFDERERLVAWNRRYVELFPYLAGRLRGGMALDEVGDIATRALLPGVDEVERAAFRERRRVERLTGAGSPSMTLPDGRIVEAIDRRTVDGLLVSVFRDVTNERATARAMLEARNAAEGAARAKSQFLAAMSHEIRTPLNAVLGMNGLLMETSLTSDQRRYVDLIGKSGESLLAIINDILDLSRLESGKLTLENVPFSLAGAVHDVVSMMSPRAQAKGIGLDASDGADPLFVRGDPGRLRQVLFNLIGNAIKFTERGRVFVEVASEDRGPGRVAASIAIHDTGVGIPEDAIPRLFERFSQADSSTSRRYGGTGLGLAICREIVELMGGQIGVESEPGVGSVFRVGIEFERSERPVAAADTSRSPEGDTTESEPAVKGLRILVADDNSVNQFLIRALLARLGHYHDVVSDGVEALRQAQSAPYDLILMDVQMPEMDGLAATRAIRALPGVVSRIPIVAMTANVMAEDRESCVAAGMNGFVGKPIDHRDLVRAIDEAMSRGGASVDAAA